MTEKTKIRPVHTLRALLRAFERFNEKDGWVMSSHVAMSIMMAIFPFILFVVALAGTLSPEVAADDLIEVVIGAWPDEIAQPLVKELRAVLAGGGRELITIGGVLAVYFASNGVDAVRAAMTQAYRESDPRPYWRRRLLSLVFVLAGGTVILLVAVLGLALPIYFAFFTDVMPGPVAAWISSTTLQKLLTVLLLTAVVMACHVWLPGLRHPLSDIWPGAVLTIALWAAAGWGFSIYISRFASYSATYAGLAGAMAALIYLYLMAAILIVGAEFNGTLIARKNR